MNIKITIILQNGDKLCTFYPTPTTNFSTLNQHISNMTKIDEGKIMLLKQTSLKDGNVEGYIVNAYPNIRIRRYFTTNVTLQLMIALHPHPSTINKPLLNKPLPLIRTNNIFENELLEDIPEHLKESAQQYFINKKNILQKYYKQSPKGLDYLKQLTLSEQYWNLPY